MGLWGLLGDRDLGFWGLGFWGFRGLGLQGFGVLGFRGFGTLGGRAMASGLRCRASCLELHVSGGF